MQKTVTIIGGGSAGWMTAAYLKKILDLDITLIESPKISTIGVGESITIHLTAFLNQLEIDEYDMMLKTGSLYKFGNNFIDWKDGKGESEIFHFKWNLANNDFQDFYKNFKSKQPSDDFQRLKEIQKLNLEMYMNNSPDDLRLSDLWFELFLQNKFDHNYSYSWSAYDYFTRNNKLPFQGKEKVFDKKGLQHAYHINAEKFGEYLKEKIALPNGVNYRQAHVAGVRLNQHDNNFIDSIILEDGSEIRSDLFIDCSGFTRVLVNQLPNKKWKHYENMPADTAYVCQVDYEEPETEMVNYTKSIAMNQGWCFDISLYHRRGTGYIFSGDLCDEDQILNEYRSKILSNPRSEPRKISWEKKRLINPASGNCVAIGMSNGFVEPMEANLFGIICNGIWCLKHILENARDYQDIDWKLYNSTMANTYDDVAEFILVHYTLSSRQDSIFWKEMVNQGKTHDHIDLCISKYLDPRNTMRGSVYGQSIFPDFMWLQLAVSWGLDISRWPRKNIDVSDLSNAEQYFNEIALTTEKISETFPNNYQFLKSNVFRNLSNREILDQFYG